MKRTRARAEAASAVKLAKAVIATRKINVTTPVTASTAGRAKPERLRLEWIIEPYPTFRPARVRGLQHIDSTALEPNE